MKIKLLLITALLAINNMFCMEKPESNLNKIAFAKLNACINYIDVDPKPMIYHGGPNLRFYGEYRSRSLENGLVSFPVNACDPLPLNTFGPIRYFFLSATGGGILTPGSAVKIDNPTITNVVVIRGKNETTATRIEAYLGYNKNDFKSKGKNRVFMAQLLAINTKNRNVETRPTIFPPAIGYLNNMDLSREIRNHLENMKDWDWKSPIFKQTMLELLGEGWILREGYNCWFCTRDEAIVSNGGVYTNKIYWTQEENKLKGFTYQRK